MILVPLFDLKFLAEFAARQELQIGGTGSARASTRYADAHCFVDLGDLWTDTGTPTISVAARVNQARVMDITDCRVPAPEFSRAQPIPSGWTGGAK